MTKISYLERQREVDPFYRVVNAAEYITGSAKTRFSQTVEETKRGEDPEGRDDSIYKTLLSKNSSGDLDFNPRMVHIMDHFESDCRDDSERDVDVPTSTTPLEPPAAAAPEEVYTGMSKEYKGILKKDEPEQDEQETSPENETNQSEDFSTSAPQREAPPSPEPPTPRKNVFPNATAPVYKRQSSKPWEKKGQVAQLANRFEHNDDAQEDEDEDGKTPIRPPPRYSISKIQQAQAGPVPKSDDFYSELKRWHKNYSLRDVEKPEQITVTSPVPATEPSEPSEQEEISDTYYLQQSSNSIEAGKKKSWFRRMKRNSQNDSSHDDETAKVATTEKPMSKRFPRRASKLQKAKEKKRKRSWSLKNLFGKKNKSSNSDSEDSSSSSRSGSLEAEAKNAQAAPSEPRPDPPSDAPEAYSMLGIARSTPTKKPIKDPKMPSFEANLSRFLKLQEDDQSTATASSKTDKKACNATVAVAATAATDRRLQMQQLMQQIVGASRSELNAVETNASSKDAKVAEKVNSDKPIEPTEEEAIDTESEKCKSQQMLDDDEKNSAVEVDEEKSVIQRKDSESSWLTRATKMLKRLAAAEVLDSSDAIEVNVDLKGLTPNQSFNTTDLGSSSLDKDSVSEGVAMPETARTSSLLDLDSTASQSQSLQRMEATDSKGIDASFTESLSCADSKSNSKPSLPTESEADADLKNTDTANVLSSESHSCADSKKITGRSKEETRKSKASIGSRDDSESAWAKDASRKLKVSVASLEDSESVWASLPSAKAGKPADTVVVKNKSKNKDKGEATTPLAGKTQKENRRETKESKREKAMAASLFGKLDDKDRKQKKKSNQAATLFGTPQRKTKATKSKMDAKNKKRRRQRTSASLF